MIETSGPKTEIGTSLMPWSAWGADDVVMLSWPNNLQVYHKMRTDGQVDFLTKAVSLPIGRRKYVVTPNGARDETVELIAAGLGLPILGYEDEPRGRRRFDHGSFVRHALLALWYGNMYFEQVGDVGDDLLWRLRKLSPRMPQTIERVHVADDGGLAGITQWGYQPKVTRTRPGLLFDDAPPQIPVTQLAAFIWEQEGADWYGRSMLRPLFRDYLLKDRALRVDAIKNERFGAGIPTGTAGPGGDPVEFQRMAGAIRATETGGVGLPNGASIGVEGVRGALPDVLASIRYYDESMARSFLAMFGQLGQTATGSRALGETFVDFFELSLDAIVEWMLKLENEHVVEDIVDWNWGPDEQAPLVEVLPDPEGPPPIDELVKLIDYGLIQVDDELRAWVRERRTLPPPGEPDPEPEPEPVPPVVVVAPAPVAEEVDTVPVPVTASTEVGGARPKAPGGLGARIRVWAHGSHNQKTHGRGGGAQSWQTQSGDRSEEAESAQRSRVVAAASPERNRAPNANEVKATTDFTAMQSTWADATDELVASWRQVRADQIDALVTAIESAVASGNPQALVQLTAPALGGDLILEYMKELMEEAATAARAEALAQGVTIELVNLADLETHLRERAQATADLMARGLSESAARQALLRYGVDALSPADVASGVRGHLEDLSDAYLHDMLGGTLTQAQNTGRKAVMSRHPATIYASELLDGMTCVLPSTLVSTASGVKRADLVMLADQLLTHSGRWVAPTQIVESMVDETIVVINETLHVTVDHEILVQVGSALTWVTAGQLREGDLILIDSAFEPRSEIGAVDRSFVDVPKRVPSGFDLEPTAGGVIDVLTRSVPVRTISLDGQFVNHEVNKVSGNPGFLLERQMQVGERFSNSTLNAGFGTAHPVASPTAVDVDIVELARTYSHLSSAVGAASVHRWASALLRAMSTTVSDLIRRHTRQRLSTSFAIAINGVCTTARKRAECVLFVTRLRDVELDVTSRTDLGDASARWPNLLSKLRRLVPALQRTERVEASCFTGRTVVRRTTSTCTSCSPCSTCDARRTSLPGLLGAAVDANLHKRILPQPITRLENVRYTGLVFDFTVPDDHTFVADGIVVHNCTRCKATDGRRFSSLSDAEQTYPTGGHKECAGGPRCRGTLVAVYDIEVEPTI